MDHEHVPDQIARAFEKRATRTMLDDPLQGEESEKCNQISRVNAPRSTQHKREKVKSRGFVLQRHRLSTALQNRMVNAESTQHKEQNHSHLPHRKRIENSQCRGIGELRHDIPVPARTFIV